MRRTILCFSHLRWDFVYQRPNHLMARAAREGRVLFVEEPMFENDADVPRLDLRPIERGLTVVRPILPASLPPKERDAALAVLVSRLVRQEKITAPILWYYTPMALPWTGHLAASAVVYDCMDQLAAFKGAPTELQILEQRLMARADLVFAGGRRLAEEKRRTHPDVHLFPSSVDREHFAAARRPGPEPADQAGIPHPRIGYFGVIDERLDLELLRELARRRPEWQLVLVGPVAKIDVAELPSSDNVHRLGMKTYAELPAYLRGWDVALLPFARNEATRYISPTKTPEYLAGGRAVVSTPIDDVVEPYGREGLARIAMDIDDFELAVAEALEVGPPERVRVDALLARSSWDKTWEQMAGLVDRLAEPHPTMAAVRARAADVVEAGAAALAPVTPLRASASGGTGIRLGKS